MSVGTPPEGITAEVMVVASFEELEARKAEARGRIVLFDFPYVSYGANVKFRLASASIAARHGARAVLIRSVGSPGLRTAHTGTLAYETGTPAIPAAALAHEDANRLRRISARGQRIVVRLEMQAHMEPDALSANLVAEIPGSESPEEIVLLGCHSDSWDLGTGAMDDGAGCVIVWEALNLLNRLDLRPRRTLRVVWFVNEENGTRGGHAYVEAHRDEVSRHVLAFEADSGAFRPKGFGFSGGEGARKVIEAVAALLAPMGADSVSQEGPGVDIGPLVRAGGLPALSLSVDTSSYMRFHHSAADTVESQDPGDLARCVGAVATMAHALADLPGTLPRSPEGSR
jgi:carboxypeptidase Q